MGRPKSDPYTLGTIATREHPTKAGQWQARGYFRDANYRRHDVTASGSTEAKARRALQAKVKEAEHEHVGGDETLNNATEVHKAARIWLDAQERKRKGSKPLSPNTLRQYAGNVDRYITGSTIEHLTLAQVNDISRVTSWLTRIADENGEGAAKAARKVLGGILSLAEQRGAISISVMPRVQTPGAGRGTTGDRICRNDDCDHDCGKQHSGVGRALDVDQWHKIADTLDEDRYGIGGSDIADLIHFLFGTGARIAEALHRVRWVDVDLKQSAVLIRGTKSNAALRTVALSTELADRLQVRKDALGGDPTGLVFGVTRFPTKLGQPRDVPNVLKMVKRVLVASGAPWAGSHTFRRTVATWLDTNGAGLAEIANQLGHANVSVTAGYLGRKAQPTRAASVMVTPPRKAALRAVSSE